jgi:hypothetical protein
LVMATEPISVILIGLRLGWGAYPDFWLDGSPVDFATWADTGTGYPQQPDRIPYPGDCTMMWVTGCGPSGCEPGRWDDITCGSNYFSGTVCKF